MFIRTEYPVIKKSNAIDARFIKDVTWWISRPIVATLIRHWTINHHDKNKGDKVNIYWKIITLYVSTLCNPDIFVFGLQDTFRQLSAFDI